MFLASNLYVIHTPCGAPISAEIGSGTARVKAAKRRHSREALTRADAHVESACGSDDRRDKYVQSRIHGCVAEEPRFLAPTIHPHRRRAAIERFLLWRHLTLDFWN